MVEKVVTFRYAFMGGVITLLLLSISLIAGGVVKFQPFPELDGDIAEARIILPPGRHCLKLRKWSIRLLLLLSV